MFAEIEYTDIEEIKEYNELIQEVVNTCFLEENLTNTNLYLNLILTNSENIKKINKKYRNINKETDVLSFPMFEKEEIKQIIDLYKKESNNRKVDSMNEMNQDVIGDIVISIPKVEEQAIEYGHSVKRELAYMVVHGFYHIMGYDHMNEEEKEMMRKKEENILQKLNITREN